MARRVLIGLVYSKFDFFQKLKFSTLHYCMKMTLDDLEIFFVKYYSGDCIHIIKVKILKKFFKVKVTLDDLEKTWATILFGYNILQRRLHVDISIG
jgi:hypothetical protein